MTYGARVALNQRQRLFVQEYLVDLNATQAARRAGYTGTDHALEVTGSRLLRHPEVAPLIAKANEKRAAKLELSGTQVLEDLQRLATKAEENGELSAAIRARELLGKHLRLFTETVHVTGTVTLEELVKSAAAK